jgi:hypothetical protein
VFHYWHRHPPSSMPKILRLDSPLCSKLTSSRLQLLTQPLPLPIAAAHHPSYLRKLKHPLAQGSKPDTVLPLKSHAGMVFAVQIEAEKRIQQLLANALSRTGSRRLEFTKAISSQPSWTTLSTFLRPLPNTFDIAYDPQPVEGLLTSIGLGQDFNDLKLDTEIDFELERRVSTIRTSILPPFPILSNVISLPRLGTMPIESRPKTRMSIMRSVDSGIPRPQKQHPDSKRSVHGSRRKSVRFSTARRLTGRPSIFGAFEDLDNSIDCVCFSRISVSVADSQYQNYF